MGSGKTTVGKELASLLSRPFYDMDLEVCQELGYASVSEIFSSEGEGVFRKKEREIGKMLSQKQGVVVASGGGVVHHKEIFEELQQRDFCVVFLHVPFFVIEERLEQDETRPLWKKKRGRELYELRLPLYRAYADIEISAIGSPTSVAKEILTYCKS